MKRNYFPNEGYNLMPCGIVAFKKCDSLDIVYANENYYEYFSGGNTDSLNIREEDKYVVLDLDEKLKNHDSVKVYYKCLTEKNDLCSISMSVCKYDGDTYLGILWDLTEQYNKFVKAKREKDKYAKAMCTANSMVFENDIIEDTSVLYVPSKDLNNIETIHISNHREYMENEMLHPNDKKFFMDHVYDPEEKLLSARMKLYGDESWKWYRVKRNFEYDESGNIIRIYGSITNIDDEKLQEKELKQKLEIDPVLKIYNRNAAVNKIEKYLKDNPERRDYAFLVIDIDDFKDVNDTYGHLYGDVVIASVTEILKKTAGESNIVGRYGGDEFLIFLRAVSDEETAERADAIVGCMSEFYIADNDNVTCSIGVAYGSSFEESPNYRDLFEKADKALYSVKKNGKAHWEAYNESVMGETDGHAIAYEKENDTNNSQLIESRDIMEVFLELSAGAKTNDSAIYRIIRYVAEKFAMDWMQVMHVNCSEDLITIKYEWCNNPEFRNNAGKSGYYVHSDIQRFRDYFKQQPIFKVCPENTDGFSMKFQREFEKNQDRAVLYNANTTTDDSFYMFVCTRFDKSKEWQDAECEELNVATKIMTMYVSQADKETESKRMFKNLLDYDKKTGLYTLEKFYEQLGRLRKLAAETGECVVLLHTDFDRFLDFNFKFGLDTGDDLLFAFANHINGNIRPKETVSTHIDGTDIFISATRINKGDEKIFAQSIADMNKEFCKKQSEKYPDENLVLKTGMYVLKKNDIGGDGVNLAVHAKRQVKNPKESFCMMYEE
ncbi:MAG: diguanylate cyclase [Oscillospiraceae bacterium]|nr:diguanylate cyclase [Oscillospiraceae bacterium]